MEAEALTGWSQAELIPNSSNAYGTTGAPALAVYDGVLYCARQGRGNSGWTWCGTFDGTNWSDDALIPGSDNAYGVSGSPALCAYNGLLYCIRQGRGDSGNMYCGTFDGTSWSDDALLPSSNNPFRLSGSPALAVFNDLLYCAFEDAGDEGWVYCTTFDGRNWSPAVLIPNSNNAYGTSGTPALAVFGDRLFCARQGRGDSGWTWCSWLDGDGDGWADDMLIPDDDNAYGMSGSPALAAHNDLLYCLRQGRGDSGDMYCGTYDGNSWSDDAEIPTGNNPFQLSASPALCEFNGTLYCAFEGSGDSGWTWAASLD